MLSVPKNEISLWRRYDGKVINFANNTYLVDIRYSKKIEDTQIDLHGVFCNVYINLNSAPFVYAELFSKLFINNCSKRNH